MNIAAEIVVLSVVLAEKSIEPVPATVIREFTFTSVGFTVPIPTLPSFLITRRGLFDESHAMNPYPVDAVEVALISNIEPGFVSPIPI